MSTIEKRKKIKYEKDLEIAQKAHDLQRELRKKGRNDGASVKTILAIKPYWEDGIYKPEEIALMVGKSKETVIRVIRVLNDTVMHSPTMKKLAIKAAKRILKDDSDNPSALKMIDKIFPEEKTHRSDLSVNLNIDTTKLKIENPDYEVIDMDNY